MSACSDDNNKNSIKNKERQPSYSSLYIYYIYTNKSKNYKYHHVCNNVVNENSNEDDNDNEEDNDGDNNDENTSTHLQVCLFLSHVIFPDFWTFFDSLRM